MTRLNTFLFLLVVMFSTVMLRADESIMPQNRPYKLPGERVFMPLPAGAVKPQGWLRDWAVAARNNYTAVMDDVDKEFFNAWKHDFVLTCIVGDWTKGCWSYEGGGYWFDGLVRLAYQLDDPELIAMAKRRLASVLEHSTPEGIGHFYWLRHDNDADIRQVHVGHGFGLWTCGLYGRAMMEYYLASGDARALKAMSNADDSASYDAITIIGLGEPPCNTLNACEDYACSGHEGVKKSLDKFCSDKYDFSRWIRFKDAPAPELLRGEKIEMPTDDVMRYHGVFFNESITGVAAITLSSGDRKYLDNALAWAKLMDDRALQPHGAIVGDEANGPTGAYRATETCGMAAEQFRRIFLFSMTGEGSEADKIERLFFNAGAGMVSRDFKQHVYMQQPNRIKTDSFLYSWSNPTHATFKRKHNPLCCTAALNRVIPIFTQNLWMVTLDKGLAAVLYAPNTVTAQVADGTKVTVMTETEYPFNETISMTVMPDKTVTFPMMLRMPDWCEKPQATLNGEKIAATPDKNGFLRIEREWKKNDKICLTFPMQPRVEQGIDRNRKDLPMPTGGCWGKGSMTGQFSDSELGATPYANIAYGPLLFVYPIPEFDENTPVMGAKWQYALNPKRVLDGVEVVRQEMAHPWRWTVDAPIKLKVKAVEGTWRHDFAQPMLPTASEIQLGKNQEITLVPYGCAKLRISMFPVVEE